MAAQRHPKLSSIRHYTALLLLWKDENRDWIEMEDHSRWMKGENWAVVCRIAFAFTFTFALVQSTILPCPDTPQKKKEILQERAAIGSLGLGLVI